MDEGFGIAEDRYSVTCGLCNSDTWFDTDEELPLMTTCWRCGEIINGDL
jgi:hypothetical protein